MTRFHREGFLEERVLVHFGYFPWGCMICKRRLLMKARGELKQKTIQHFTGTSMPIRAYHQTEPAVAMRYYRKLYPTRQRKFVR